MKGAFELIVGAKGFFIAIFDNMENIEHIFGSDMIVFQLWLASLILDEILIIEE